MNDFEFALTAMRACLDGLEEALDDDVDEAIEGLLEHAQALADEARASRG